MPDCPRFHLAIKDRFGKRVDGAADRLCDASGIGHRHMKARTSDWIWGLALLGSAFLMWGDLDRHALDHALGLALSLAMVSPALLALWWLDRLPPTSARTWWRSLGFGIFIISILATYIHRYVGFTVTEKVVESEMFEPGKAQTLGDLAGSILSAPIFEETLKGLLPFLILLGSVDHAGLKRRDVGPWPAVLSGVLVSLAFGSVENASHFATSFSDWQGRLFFAYLHAAFSLPMLLAIGFAALLPSLSSRMALSLGGWVVSVVLHAWWNADVSFRSLDWGYGGIRHAALLSPLICVLGVGFAYTWEWRALRRGGALPPPLSRPPRSGEIASTLAARELVLSRPLGSA